MVKKYLFTFLLLIPLMGPTVVLAQATSQTTNYDYVLLEEINGTRVVNASNFPAFAQQAIRLIISISTALSVLMFTIGGFQYLTGESLEMKGDGRKYMTNAIVGLLLILCAYLILNTINPQLINLNLMVPSASRGVYMPGGGAQSGGTLPVGSGQTESDVARGDVRLADNGNCRAQTPSGYNFVQSGARCPANVSATFCCVYSKAPTPAIPSPQGCFNCVPVTLPTNGNACTGTTCYVNQELQSKLTPAFETLRAQGILIRLSETWPPVATHQSAGHKNGTSVDLSLPKDGSGYARTDHVAASLFELGKTGKTFKYEVASEARKEQLVAADINPLQITVNTRRVVTNTCPNGCAIIEHFTMVGQ